MPDLSEFVSFIAEKSEIGKEGLIEKDVILHRILKEIYSNSYFSRNYLFKGGTCLVKCYFGYYRFSVDLDFTWRDQDKWGGLGSKRLRRFLLSEIEKFGSFLESNFIEKLIFKQERKIAKTLLVGLELDREEKIYFADFINFYSPVNVLAYSKEELLCEKIRAILTRRGQKLRDFYDVFMLYRHGLRVEKLREEIVDKIREGLYYKKYRDNIEENRRMSAREIIERPFERDLFLIKLGVEFDDFLKGFAKELGEIAELI